MKKEYWSYMMIVFGLMLLACGLFLIKTMDDPSGIMTALPYICVGLGCGVFGHGTGDVINRRALKNSPDIAKQVAIEKNDERNITIGNRAKAKAYDIMVPVFGALGIAFALMGENLEIVLLWGAAYLFVCGCNIFYRCKYEKKM